MIQWYAVCGMRYAVCGMRYAGSITHCHSSCTSAAAQTSRLSSNYSYLNSQSNYFNSGSPVDWGDLTADLFAHGVNQPSLVSLQARLIALALTCTAKAAELKTSNIIKLLDQNCRQIEKIKIAAVVVLALHLERG